MLKIEGLDAIGEVRPGGDLAALLAVALRAAGCDLAPFDVLVVTQKIVPKAEGRFVDLATIAPGAEALRLAEITRKEPRLIELVLAESSAVIRAAPHVLITRHRSGHVMANAGIDRSNIGPAGDDIVLLLPQDADASADRLRVALEREWPAGGFGVVVSDSFGRPWRHGVTNVAIGASGLPALVDRRGMRDRDGRVLEVTQVAIADMVASAAGLVTGEGAEGVPAAHVRGLHWDSAPLPAQALLRPVAEDLFR